MIYKLKFKSLVILINYLKIKSISTNNSIIQKLKCLSLFKLNKLELFFLDNNYNHILYFLIQALIRNHNLKKDLIQNGYLIKINL